ncbi:MAG: tail fiber domain-containing protein [Myxococcales bacterium]|nr:tail fiber domain-containing protein [Myxococcales bacterium]
MRDRSRTGQATLLAVSISAGIALASPSIAADLTATLDAGAGFSVRDDTGAIERLRVDEATGNLSRNGALFVHTTGNHNLFVGAGAGSLTTTGFTGANAAFGEAALGAITTGFWNAALGYRALAANTSGDRNAALGTRALEHNTTGFFNTATGHRSLGSNTTGYYNTSTGTYAMGLNTTGTRNTALGDAALQSNQNGSRNTGSGFLALTSNTVGFQNTAAGSGALAYNTSGSKNTAAGAESLRSNTTGSNNTAAGYGALYSLTSGSSNIAVGYTAGAGLTAGSNNIYLANQGAAAESGQIRIGTLGTHTQATIAGIHGRTSTGGIAVLVNASGTLGTTTSSARFKRDVADMGDASDVLMKLRPVVFHYTEEAVGKEASGELQYGLIAEEVADIAPELVAPGADGAPYSVKYHVLPALLLNEVQQQRAEIARLRSRVAELEHVRDRAHAKGASR